jgi:tRNA G18 (ribose-2'-O)-methylase SpoU
LAFIEEAIDLLDLNNVKIYPHKVGPNFGESIQSVIARDFGSIADILELVAPILAPQGQVFLLKGPNAPAEVREAQGRAIKAHYTDLTAISYQVGSLKRSLVKTAKITPKEAVVNPYQSLEIASPKNPRFRGWLKLLTGRTQRKAGETLGLGQKIVKELLTNHPDLLLGLIAVSPRDLEGFPVSRDTPIFFVRSEIFPELDPIGAGPPIAWLKTPEIETWDPTRVNQKPFLLIPFQDPNNVGAVIRAAAALGPEVVLLAEAASPFHYRALRVAGPAVFLTKLWRGPSYRELPFLERDDLYALSPRGADIFSWDPPENPGLVLGSEGQGLDSLWPESQKLSIPMKPGLESLNGGVAAAMALAILKAKGRL